MKRHTFMSDGYYAISGEETFDDQNENYCGAAIDKLAYYENLEEQGRLSILPCKVGDVVYCIWRYIDFMGNSEEPFIKESTAMTFVLDGHIKPVPSDYGEMADHWYKLLDVRFTREEVETALMELKEKVPELWKNKRND